MATPAARVHDEGKQTRIPRYRWCHRALPSPQGCEDIEMSGPPHGTGVDGGMFGYQWRSPVKRPSDGAACRRAGLSACTILVLHAVVMTKQFACVSFRKLLCANSGIQQLKLGYFLVVGALQYGGRRAAGGVRCWQMCVEITGITHAPTHTQTHPPIHTHMVTHTHTHTLTHTHTHLWGGGRGAWLWTDLSPSLCCYICVRVLLYTYVCGCVLYP